MQVKVYETKRVFDFPLALLLATVFVIVAYLVHMQSVSAYHFASDTDEHIIILYRVIYEPGYYISHPLWHIVTFIVSKVLHISIENAAAVSSAFFVTLWTGIVYCVVRKIVKLQKGLLAVMITAIIIVVGPLCIPWYNKIIFFGQGSPNIWHNVTLWTVKPIALLGMLFLFEALKSKAWKYYFFSLFCVVLSIFAKPSFIIMFLPALAGFTLIKHLFADRKFVIYLAILGSISLAILYIQYLHTFESGETSVIIDLLGVWSESSRNISLSIVLALAFPLAFTFLHTKILYDDAVLLSWLMVFVGIFYYAVFAQTGRFYSHGNFGWSYMIAMSFLYLFTIVKFFEYFKILSRWKRAPLLFLLLIQIGTGIYYLEKVLQGQNPLYIAIFL